MTAKEQFELPVLWSPEAEQDLLSILDYVWRRASASIAERIVRDIHEACLRLGAFPDLGKSRPDVRPRLRAIRAHRYVAFYRVTKSAVEIVRVFDERRDVDLVFPAA